MYSIVERGKRQTTDYAAYFMKQGFGFVSPFHDIPLIADAEKGYFNMVVEIPRWTSSKMEITKDVKLNPIKQDVKKGKLRYVDSVFPYHGYIWNYGAFPQTWEDPGHVDGDTNAAGDNDPLDVIEFGSKIHPLGSVIIVKVLGILAMIDEGETDWKVIVLDVNDPLAEKVNDIEDVEKYFPGYVKASVDWFRDYKIPTGKPPNEFAFCSKPKNRDFALRIVKETHSQWQQLIGQMCDGQKSIECINTTVGGSPFNVPVVEAEKVVNTTPTYKPNDDPVPQTVNKWWFINHQACDA